MKKEGYNVSGTFLKVNQMLWKKSFLQGLRKLFYCIDSVLLLGTGSKKKAKHETDKKRLLVVYNMALGDGVMFRGVDSNLRDIYPSDEWEITIACQSAFKQLYETSGIYDKIIPIDFSGAVVNLKNRRAMFKKLREEKYDEMIDPIGCELCTTNVYVSRAVIADKKIGVLDKTLPHYECSKRRQRKIYNQIVEIYKKDLHLIEFYAEFFKELGAKNCVAKPAELPRFEIDFELPDKFFIIFPTASMGVKRWPAERFAKIAEKIHKEYGMPLVVCGTKHDEPVIMEMLKYIPDVPVVNVIGQSSIMQFTEVIGRASLIVTNDTSAYHIGVARQVDTVMICGGYTYNRYAKYNYSALGYKDPALAHKSMECYNCNNHCIYNNKELFPCIDAITTEMVWNEVVKFGGNYAD